MTQTMNQKKKKRFMTRRRPGWKSFLMAVIMLASVAFLLFQTIRTGFLPWFLALILMVILVCVSLLLVLLWFNRARTPLMRTLCGVLCVVITVSCLYGGYAMGRVAQAFEDITHLTDQSVHTISLLALKDKGIDKVSDLNGKAVGISPNSDQEGTEKELSQLQSQAKVTVETYDSLVDLVQALKLGEVAAIILPEEDRGLVYDQVEGFNLNMDAFALEQTIYYTKRTETDANDPDPVASITRDAFTILVSGNDSYGGMDTNGRSDVNMLVTINPKTAVVLLTSIPRDSYVRQTCRKDRTACDEYDNLGYPVKDKLTHTGLSGIGTTESTIEDMLGVEINYTVRVNFSSLVNLVDALGGIDVFVEDGLAVDTFYTNGSQGVAEGWNHLEGERALAFARERYAYLDGDLQRVRNQSLVMNALIRKVASPEIFVRFPALMDALGVAFETNMPAGQIKQFIQFEVLKQPKWQILSYAVAGESGFEYSYRLGDNAAVTLYDASMAETAKEAIDAVEKGDSFEAVQAICESNAVLPAGAYSSAQQEDKISQDRQEYGWQQEELEEDTWYGYDEADETEDAGWNYDPY